MRSIKNYSRLLLLLLAMGFSLTCFGQQALDRAAALDEARFKHLTLELRCLVCQNQTLFDSNAALAVDLREQVKLQMSQGKSDAEIRAFMVARYGEFILYKPAFEPTTWLLWGVPFVLLLAGLGLWLGMARRASREKSIEVTASSASTHQTQARAWLDSKSD